MALTRKALKAMGIADEQADQIIAMHTETTDGLKAQADAYEADAKKLPEVQKKLDEATAAAAEAAKAGEKDPYKVKYEAVKEEFEAYKTKVAEKETMDKKQAAYRQLLADCKVHDKRHDAILRVANIDELKLDDNGNIAGAEDVKKKIAEEWADFITTEGVKGAQTGNPPAKGGADPDYDSMSDEDYYKTINKKKE